MPLWRMDRYIRAELLRIGTVVGRNIWRIQKIALGRSIDAHQADQRSQPDVTMADVLIVARYGVVDTRGIVHAMFFCFIRMRCPIRGVSYAFNRSYM